MTNELSATPVTSDELLSRFILSSRHLRQDHTIRADAFVPHPYTDLSVTRHLFLSNVEIWNIGMTIATKQQKALFGHAVIQVSAVEKQRLRVAPDPLADNLNHANITDWPTDKPLQKAIAQELAAAAGKVQLKPKS